MEIKTAILCEADGHLQGWLQAAYDGGFELLAPPILADRGVPQGRNSMFEHAFFLVVVGRRPKT